MSFTDFYFLLVFAGMLIIYYLIPKKTQWFFLLLASVAFYVLSGEVILILYPVISCLLCYACVVGISSCGVEKPRAKKAWLLAFVLSQIGILFLLKYINFGINTVNAIVGLFGIDKPLSGWKFLVPLGISYYTFSLIGYVVDVYNGIADVQKNPLKIALYGMYFPVIVSGPIIKYREDAGQFFEPHSFDYKRVTYGLQRMLWGFFKKLVIAERMGILVGTVYGNMDEWPGIYIWFGTIAFAFQLYTDFSGLMDIALGMSECFGLKMPENFDTPFFAKNISEYWRRWHITLGVWMKEYVFYPVLRTGFFTNLNKKWKEKFGKKKGKQYTTFLAMLILWLTVGIWHGGNWTYVIGSGLLHWMYIVVGELCDPSMQKLWEKLHINSKSKWMDRLRVLRTFFLVNIGFVFFRNATVYDAVRMLGLGLKLGNIPSFVTGGCFGLGLDFIELTIAVVSLIILLVVSKMQQKGSVRDAIAKKHIVLRFIIWYALLFYVILLGQYGPGYSAAEFIYQGF